MCQDDIIRMKQRHESNLDNCSARLAHVGILLKPYDAEDDFDTGYTLDDEPAYLDKQPIPK